MDKDIKVIREFEYNDKKYKLTEPSAKAIREAKLKYSIKFTEGVKNGLYVKRSLEKVLKENDPEFFEDYNKDRKELLKQLADTEKQIKESENEDQLEVLAQMMAIYRAQLMEEDQLIASLYENTADQIAEEERISVLAYYMVSDLEGNKVTESYQSFIDDIDSGFYEQCKYEVLCWQYQLDPDWQSNLPELKAAEKAQKIRADKEKEENKKEEKTSKRTSTRQRKPRTTRSTSKRRTAKAE